MIRVPLLAVMVGLLVLKFGHAEETERPCSISPPSWSSSSRECQLFLDCPIVEEGYVKNMEHTFLCEDNTTIWWNYPPKNSAINMKMWFEGKTDEYRVCLHKVPYWQEGTYNVVHYDLNSDDVNGPILAIDGNVPDGPEPEPANYRQPCVLSSGGYVKFRFTSTFQGYGQIVSLKTFPIDAGNTELIETDGNPPEGPEAESCEVIEDSRFSDGCEVMIVDCPTDSAGKVEFQMKNDCQYTVMAWHYSWSHYLDVTTSLPSNDQDFRFCLHGATSPGNMTYYSEEIGTSVTVSHPHDESPAKPNHCFSSKDGYAKFKLSVDQTYYVVWFNVSYADVHDISGSDQIQSGMLLQTIMSTLLLCFIKQM